MEVFFLGTGTSEGVPVIAQPDDIELDLDNPKNWRTRTSVHVVMDGCHVQVDAAPEFRLQCIQNNIRKVDHFILTHGHADHIQGMDDLRRFCRIRDGHALPVYGHDDGLKRVREIYPYAIRDFARGNYPAFNLLSMPSKLELEGGTIQSILLPHGKFNTLGLVFIEKTSQKKFSYYTDCNEVPEAACELASGSDLLALDALRFNPHPSHMSIEKAIYTAMEINATKTQLVHMTCQVDVGRDSHLLPNGIEFAYDGLRITI